ncbi:RlmE family RNA methyltransferase [Marinicauda algicola]|uniref:Ribosomal RNA large subunit methyltransferase E n=1 Tax=Marinicauda algicola TaxID=2029849 RepID=A0A4S2GWL7_9PROT|nr:RlmE family RNA methyltransferase [Marinicauda algicola]TGY87467.1 RlmE family RNA methyltransferase [Marinicauda algicola]
MSDENEGDGEERRRRRTGPVKRGGDTRAAKQFHERVKTARKRKLSSQRWLERQLNDPYVQRAKQEGYRSRAAYKLTELDDRFHFLKAGARVADLGAAPGGWVQVALQRGASKVVGVDLLEMEPIAGAELLTLDFTEPGAPDQVKAALGGPADVVLSDLAPWTTGHKQTDHLRIMALVEAAAQFAVETLKPGGTFVAKVFQGGAESEVLDMLKARFDKVKHAKPEASRAESAETYLVATGFRG